MAKAEVEVYEPPRLDVIGKVAELTQQVTCSISPADFCIKA